MTTIYLRKLCKQIVGYLFELFYRVEEHRKLEYNNSIQPKKSSIKQRQVNIPVKFKWFNRDSYITIEPYYHNYYMNVIVPKILFNFSMVKEFREKYGNTEWFHHDIEGYDDICYEYNIGYERIVSNERYERHFIGEKFITERKHGVDESFP